MARHRLHLLTAHNGQHSGQHSGSRDYGTRRPGELSAARRAGTAGALAGVAARACFVAGQLFLVIGAILTYGLVAVLFLRSFLPVTDMERTAWLRLAGSWH